LNPASILVDQSTPMRMKILQVGLLSKIIHFEAKHETKSQDLEMFVKSHRTWWMLPESWLNSTDEGGNEIITLNPTTYGDVFAAG
jgi:hypothetical protein